MSDSFPTPQRVVDPAVLAANKGKLLPGIAGIAVFLLVYTLLNVFAALQNTFVGNVGKYAVLTLCTLLVAGIFGLLKMKRWGWALVTTGCLLASVGYFFLFTRSHNGPALIQGLFMLVFFFYLSRSEVRDRLI